MRSNCPCTSLPGILASYSSLESIKTARQIHDFIQNCKKLLGLFRCKHTIFLSFQLFKQGQGYAVFTCKTKTTRNPLYKWAVGESVSASNTSTASSINEFAFSPCGHYLAVSSQDGYLRVFNYDTMELVGSARSYFGGLLCVCWSPDGKYVAVGGEDDLVTLYSMAEKRVVVRGQGHKSWVSVVAFDQ